MKFRFAGLLSLLVAVAFVAGCCCQPSGPQTLTTSDGLAQITVTDGMSKTTLMENPDASLQAANIFRELYALVISESSSIPELTGFDIDSYADLVRTNHSASLNSVNATPIESTTINGHPARKWSATGSADGVECFFIFGVVEAGGYYNQVMAWTLEDRRST